MKAIFRTVPLRQFTEYSRSHLHGGAIYHARFQERPGRAAMWTLEQPLIRDIFRHLDPKRMLDFATGTGRIVSVLEPVLARCELHGIDISADMLAIARAKGLRTTFQEMDGRRALDHFGRGSFDAISAFRFFPNADQTLREEVADQIADLIKPGGHVVLNNHRNFWSLSYLAMRAVGNSDGNYGTPNAEIRRLFAKRGFSCVRSYSLGVWPQTDFRVFCLSWPAALRLERVNLRYFCRMHTSGYNTVFVFRKSI